MAIQINNEKYLSYEEQVLKNKEDIKTLQDEGVNIFSKDNLDMKNVRIIGRQHFTDGAYNITKDGLYSFDLSYSDNTLYRINLPTQFTILSTPNVIDMFDSYIINNTMDTYIEFYNATNTHTIYLYVVGNLSIIFMYYEK